MNGADKVGMGVRVGATNTTAVSVGDATWVGWDVAVATVGVLAGVGENVGVKVIVGVKVKLGVTAPCVFFAGAFPRSDANK